MYDQETNELLRKKEELLVSLSALKIPMAEGESILRDPNYPHHTLIKQWVDVNESLYNKLSNS